MPFRTVTKAIKEAEKLAGHARQHAERVALSATEPYSDRLSEDRPFLTVHEHQVFLGETLAEARAELVAIDDRHVHELQIVANLREQRDRTVSSLRELLFQLKRTLDGYFGAGGSNRFFEEAPIIPSDPVALHQLADRVFNNLTDPEFPVPEPQQEGVLVSPRVMASGFEDDLVRLGQLLGWLRDSESESKHTQSLKDAAVERLEKLNGQVGRYFEALYDIAGHERLSDRLRTSTRRRSSDAADSETGDDSEPDPEPFDDGEDSETVDAIF